MNPEIKSRLRTAVETDSCAWKTMVSHGASTTRHDMLSHIGKPTALMCLVCEGSAQAAEEKDCQWFAPVSQLLRSFDDR